MIRLVFLLLGTRALKPMWRILATVGIAWMLLGACILFDLGDGKLSIVLDTLAFFLIVEGIVEIAAACARGARDNWIDAVRGLAFLFFAFVIFDVPWDNNIAAAILFGLAFLADGIFRVASAFVIHSKRWRIGTLAGLVEIGLALIILTSKPLPHRLTVPFCFALLLLTSGYALWRMAIQLRALPEGASVTTLPLYATRNWQGSHRPPSLIEHSQQTFRNNGALNVYVWTALGSIRDPERRVLVDRYVAAVDKKGVVATGHSALEMPPNLYISHYPLNDIDHNPDDFRALLNAGHQNDVAGRFNASLAIEAAAWCMPDQKISFSRFNPEALEIFWHFYSQDKTYNLTARNCSTTVIQALDAALEGSSFTGRPLRDFFRIVSDPNFWLMRIVRGRAEAMTWTPGMVLDYSRLLYQVVEQSDRRWRRKLQEAFRTRRK
ncbi:HdeD family acid-resistance protein [Ochrobactrum teleogrylli]|uniref:HdeD family acid-resistance protein n=1 Tax=Ochrobactrum teleogrylli TaxID=2479765 RepID=UPI00384E170A